MPANEAAIYAPAAACLYEREPEVTGGAERQTTLLARGLVGSGLRVAHIVLPVSNPIPLAGRLRLVERELVATGPGSLARMGQMRRIWSALAEADAGVYVFRSGIAALGIAAAFCRVRRRRLVFSSSNNLDFTFDFFAGRRAELALYKHGARSSNAIVVQSRDQRKLAQAAFPGGPRVIEIPSFAELADASTDPPEAFLWVGRLDRYKQPLRYVELAEAVPEARFWMVVRRLDPGRSGGSPGGGEDPELEREVEDRASRLDNLEILGQRPHVAAMELVDRSVAIVNTGVAEGMPNLFLEAWARGVPVLTYGFDPDGRVARNGLGVVADDSPERLATGARQLWEARGDRDELRGRLREYVESTHGIEAVSGRWVGLIAELNGA